MIDMHIHPMTWWLTGLSAAGKSTLAQGLKLKLMDANFPACVLDGDVIRLGLSSDLDFSPEARTEQIRRTAEIAKMLNDQGIWVAVALVSPIRAARQMARAVIGAERFIEVYVSTSLMTCVERDPKGLYAKAQKDPSLGLTGLQSSYEEPIKPDLILDTEAMSIQQSLNSLITTAEMKAGMIILKDKL